MLEAFDKTKTMKATGITLISIFAVAIFTYSYISYMFNDLAEPVLFDSEPVASHL